MNNSQKQLIEKILDKTILRMRLQLCLDAATLGIALSAIPLSVALLLWNYQNSDPILWICLTCITPLFVAVIVRLLWPISKLLVAQKIDIANDFQERLSTTYDFILKQKTGERIDAQIQNTIDHLHEINPNLACPYRKPKFWKWAILGIFIVLVVCFIPIPRKNEIIPEFQTITISQEESIIYPSNIDSGTAKIREDQLEELIQTSKIAENDEQEKIAQELLQLLKDDQEGKLTPEQFEKKRKEIEQKLESLQNTPEEVLDKVDKRVQNAVKENIELQQQPETKKLAQALENNNYDEAAKIMKELLKQAESGLLDEEKLQKLAKTFEKLADKLNLLDSELQKAMQKNKDLIKQLEDKFNKNNKLSNKDQKSLDEAKQKEQEYQKEKTQSEQTPEGKALKKLENAFKNASEKLKNTNPKNNQQPKPESNQQNLQQPLSNKSQPDNKLDPDNQNSEQQEQNQNNNNSQNNSESENNSTQDNPKQEQQNDKTNNLQNSDPNKKDNSQTNNDPSQKPDKTGTNQNDNPEDSLQDTANQKISNENNKNLKKAAQDLKKDAQRNEGSNSQQQNRQKNVEDFLKKAKGQNPQSDQNQGNPSNDQPQQDGGELDSGNGQQQQNQLGLGANELPGKGHSESQLDNPTNIDVNYKDAELKSHIGKGESTSEIIKNVGQQGFASQSYKEVFQNYEKAAEESLEQENIPQGYKHYIERYFDYIRPQNTSNR